MSALRRLLCQMLGHRWVEIWHGFPPCHELRRECRRCHAIERRVRDYGCTGDSEIAWRWELMPLPASPPSDSAGGRGRG